MKVSLSYMGPFRLIFFPVPKLPPTANFAQQPMASILKHGLAPGPRPAAILPPIRYAAAAAAAVTPQVVHIQNNR